MDWWFWVGPKTSLPNIKREFRKWNATYGFRFSHDGVEAAAGEQVVVAFTYEGLKTWMDLWKPGQPFPAGLICDESSRLKNAGDNAPRPPSGSRT